MFSVTDFAEITTDGMLVSLLSMLFALGRGAEVERAISDIAFRNGLYKEFSARA